MNICGRNVFMQSTGQFSVDIKKVKRILKVGNII